MLPVNSATASLSLDFISRHSLILLYNLITMLQVPRPAYQLEVHPPALPCTPPCSCHTSKLPHHGADTARTQRTTERADRSLRGGGAGAVLPTVLPAPAGGIQLWHAQHCLPADGVVKCQTPHTKVICKVN